MLQITSGDIVQYVQSVFWPFLRAIGLFMVGPVFSGALIPARIKIILALSVALIIGPLAGPSVQPASPIEPLGVSMMLIAANQVLIGVAIGFMLQIIFEAITFAGQLVATTMGLGFASLVDPLRGASVPVLSQFLLIMGLLIFLALDGHIAMIRLLAESFQWLPVGESMFSAAAAQQVVAWGGRLFSAGLMIGLPAIVALVIVNLALGVVSRAAPSLNLFAVGFPVTLGVGLLIMMLSLYNLKGHMADLLQMALDAVRMMLSAGATP